MHSTPHHPRRAAAAAALIVSSALTLSGCASQPADTLQVFAASSTRVLNEDLQAQSEIPLAFNNGGSSELVHTIHEGAPADLLLTASAATMDMAVHNGDVDAPRTLATNTMVMVVPRGNPAGISSIHDLTDDTRLVLCDPQVPCGDTSQRIMQEAGLNVSADSLEGQVADVLGKVASGEADAGWVYSTDAAASDDVEAIEIDGAERFRNEIKGAVVSASSRREEAQALLDLLATEFSESWRAHGFSPADSPSPSTASRPSRDT
ncbi:molybdate ABC transporter substrate-binding protein [Corynebacterium sp.]|uniref:molybdate ABC transporter substrate-binding protein n=1 Tax=Corynebacterium sp. TaxID=1720 RepID=UPI0026DB10AF|nr:molybdate ABC transporter substrate-binding protein [Corynebacterium sp.]MDO5031958.1 molybdate ABC transporter substrate-binding protein [Corynebacterium sp.]